MSDLPIQLAVNLMEYWILLLLMQYVCAAHIRFTCKKALLCSGISILGTILAVTFFNSYSFIISMVAEIALTVLLFSARRPSDLLRFFPALAIYFTLTVAPQCMLEELIPAAQINFIFHDYTLTLFGLLTDIVLLAALLALRFVLTKYQTVIHFSVKEVLGSIALFFFSFIDVALVMLLNRARFTPIVYWSYIAVFVGGLVVGVIYYLYSLAESRIRIYRQSIVRSEREYLQMQLDSLRDVKENHEQVKKMRHDLNNHMAMIASLCEAGNYEEARKYTRQLSHEVIPPDSRILTGNQTADLVVASKIKICEAHGITFEFSGSMNNLSALAAPDICGLLGNAYDNAIEACIPQAHAYIRTAVNATRNYTVIRIVNSVEKKVPIHGNHVATAKKDKERHGYGMDIMKQIAQKYNGSCTFGCNEREFTVKITLLT